VLYAHIAEADLNVRRDGFLRKWLRATLKEEEHNNAESDEHANEHTFGSEKGEKSTRPVGINLVRPTFSNFN
jgi:hypothetical protein